MYYPIRTIQIPLRNENTELLRHVPSFKYLKVNYPHYTIIILGQCFNFAIHRIF
jgi:hypothetical protein